MRFVNGAATRIQALVRGETARVGHRVSVVTSLTPDDTHTRGFGSSGARSARVNKNMERLHANGHFQRARSALADVLITSVREVLELSFTSAAVTLQAAVRGWKLRRFLPKIREAKAEFDGAWLEYERDEFARLCDAHIPTRRSHMLAIHGTPLANCDGVDGCSRGVGGKSKVLRSIIGDPHSAVSMHGHEPVHVAYCASTQEHEQDVSVCGQWWLISRYVVNLVAYHIHHPK